jgi:uncharacterized membrane protein
MRQWLVIISEPVIIAIDAIALLAIIIGTIEVLFTVVRAGFRPLGQQLSRHSWLRYARWLVAALTFQLAADIIETSISTDWQTIGRVGAIAVIRTFLDYFLGRDVEQEQRERLAAEPRPPPSPGSLAGP